ncbi:MAG: bifunctional [glutamine synthetase] adenylyltransferase/[glutamine synthetase]-adenylyl-L-tyrosine phosphorylase [Streptosporangiaceae bacterium]|jgi:glutamate-ammonia-ligase adenylyltransferase
MPRGTLAGQLAALGFADTGRAQRLLFEELGLDAEGADVPLVEALAAAADPDLALASLARMAPGPALRAALHDDLHLRDRLISVLGVSAALGDHLARHRDDWQLLAGPEALARPSGPRLRAELLAAVGAGTDSGAEAGQAAIRAAAAAGPGAGGANGAGSAADRGGPEAPVADRERLGGRDPATQLRTAYRRRLLRLAARDLTGAEPIEAVMAELADLATAALEGALAIARADLPAGPVGPAACRLAVIAMGKCGGRELNYASDVDVIFVAEPASADEDESAALRTATMLASGMIRVCSHAAPEGALFPVDPNLRPEGRSGPLVRTLASHVAYYERWAKTWEFQALLKARPAAGDSELGAAYVAALEPMVWQAAQRDDFVTDVQAMRRRVIGSLPPDEAGRELKLGPGGLRDIEFAVQLLQLVHGRADPALRVPSTLEALAALAAGGYVGRADAASLGAAYRFLRGVEHLLQLRQLRRTHMLPEDPAVLRQLGRALPRMRLGSDAAAAAAGPDGAAAGLAGSAPGPGRAWTGAGSVLAGSSARTGVGPGRPDPADEFTARWRRHASQVRQLHEKLFYRPLLGAVAQLPGTAVRLTPAAAAERLEALGYIDPAGALRHIEVLSSGVSRKAAIQRTLLPVLLGWFADAPQPDAGLLAFRQVSEALGGSPWYLRLLRDNMIVAQRMARVLASSRYATGLLLRAPEAVAMLGSDAELAPVPLGGLRAEAMAAVGRHDDLTDAVRAVLAIRRRELLRTAMADVLNLAGAEDVGAALTTVAVVTIEAALQAVMRDFERRSGPLPTRLAVIAMGRLGGQEMGYASDADVLFVHDPRPGAGEEAATRAAHAVAEELRAVLGQPGADPVLHLDAGLRPEGRQGPLVRTLASYRAYYRRWSLPWEAQALLRARPAAGDRELGEAFLAIADEFRHPAGGIDEASVREIRRIKARMEAERMPRGIEPALHLKFGPGGLTDVEWVVQLLQLRHAGAMPELRTTRTLGALGAAVGAGLMSAADGDALTAAWLLATRIRDAVMLARGRASDTLPTAVPELSAVARLLGYPPDGYQELAEDWRRAARRARAVMERLFYG